MQNVLKTIFGIDLPYSDLEALYEEILKVVRNANIVEQDYNSLDSTVDKRSIYRQDILALVHGASVSKVFLERVDPQVETSSEDDEELTKLEQKTQEGGFDSDSILYLKEMRASANLLFRKYRGFSGTRKRLEQLSMQVQRICLRVKSEAKIEDLDGIEQWLRLEKYLIDLSETDRQQSYFPAIGVDYLFGEVGDLTGKCKIRWGAK